MEFDIFVYDAIPEQMKEDIVAFGRKIPERGLVAVWHMGYAVSRIEAVGSTPTEIQGFYRRLMAEDMGVAHLPQEWQALIINAKLKVALGEA